MSKAGRAALIAAGVTAGLAATAAGVAAAVSLAAAAAGRRVGRGRYELRDRVVLISGGSRGFGLALARVFIEEGARVRLLARSEPELARAREELASHGADVETYACDVRDRDAVQEVVDHVIAADGSLDVLVHNAEVIDSEPFEHAAVEDFAMSRFVVAGAMPGLSMSAMRAARH